jgi:DNA-binding MarR family transcriptional regulator
VQAAISGIGHLVRRLAQAQTRIWQDTVGDELTGPQFTVLGILHTKGPMDQRTLGEHARLDKSTAAPLIERLRQRGLVEVARDTADKRRKLLRITPAGDQCVIRLGPPAVIAGDRLLAPLSPADRQVFLDLLATVTAIPPAGEPADDPERTTE